ncbi:MAG: DUF2490 domain-containing protein [Bacteroidota bacterium]
MKRHLKLFLPLIFFATSFSSYGQDSDLGNWIIYIGSKKINSKLNWHHEVQYRNYNAIGDLEQLLLRTGLGINLSENNNNLLFGYGFILSENYLEDSDEKSSVSEHRLFQQFITKQKFSRVGIQHRYRFEQRFVEDDFKLRFRYFLGVSLALTQKEMTDKTLYLSAYNEIFLNTEGGAYDRNRLYGGLGYKVNKLIRVEAGYMNQFLGDANRDQINLITFLNF